MKLNFLKENIGKILLDIGLANSFLDTRPKTQAKKAKINKWYYIKLTFLHCQKKGERMKTQSTECKKILTNLISEKRLITNRYK